MTVQEAAENALNELRENDFFKNVDIRKLMRELYPEPYASFLGVGFKDVNRRCGMVYDDIAKKFEEIPEDKRPDKTTFYAAAIKSIQKKGDEELGKAIGFMYASLND